VTRLKLVKAIAEQAAQTRAVDKVGAMAVLDVDGFAFAVDNVVKVRPPRCAWS